jgi:hypothetical protein
VLICFVLAAPPERVQDMPKRTQEIGYEGAVSPEPLQRFPAGTSAGEVARASLAFAVTLMKKSGIKVAS